MVFAGNGMPIPAFRFTAQVTAGRWFMFFASILIMAAAGGTYIFGIYSKDIKTSLGYDQQTLNTLSFFKDVGANVGILPGLINEVTPPWVVLFVGAAMNLVGYLMIYLSIDGCTARPPVWLMCVYIAVGANSQSFANTGALVTCVKNFPEDRGVVLGLLKGFVGLSGAIFTQLYLSIYGGNNGKSLVLLMAWLPAAISVLFIPTIRLIPRVGRPVGERRTFFYFLYASVVLAVYLLVMIIIEQQVKPPRPARAVIATILVLLIFLPLTIVVKQELKTFFQGDQSVAAAPNTTLNITVQKPVATQKTHPLALESEASTTPATENNVSCFQNVFKPPARGDDYTILQALFSIDMLVLFFATICGVGGTLTAIDNMGQIGQSLGYPPRSINTFVSLVSIWNYAGRVAAGFASEFFLSKYRVPRPLALTIVLLLACVGHALIAFGVHNSLYAASVILGFCFGAQWPLLFAIISEVFGLKYYSTLYNFGAVASPIGSYVLNVRVAGHLYDREAAKQANVKGSGDHGHDLTCIGVQCYKVSFLIITGVTLLGALVSLVLVWRTRKFYSGDLYARFRDGENGRREEEEESNNSNNG